MLYIGETNDLDDSFPLGMVVGDAHTVVGDAHIVVGDAHIVVGDAHIVVGDAHTVVGDLEMSTNHAREEIIQ